MNTPVTLCLHIICKNDAENIISCLRSVHDHITDWVICDIGSTDNTKAVILNFYQQNPKPGHLYELTFENWGKTKTLALHMALQYTQSDYILLLRANEILQYDSDKYDSNQQTLQSNNVLSNIRDNKITNEIHLQHVDGHMEYNNTTMILCKDLINPIYVGVTHDYFSYDNIDRKPTILTDMAKIKKVSHGFMTSSDKIKLDITLLHQGLLDEPNNPRYLYYLAKTYFETNDYYNAIIWFNKRYKYYNNHKNDSNLTTIDRFWEEPYSSLIYISKCHLLLKHDYDTIIKPIKNAIELYPRRLEAPQLLMQYTHMMGTPHDNLSVARYIVQYFGTKYRVYHDTHDYHLFVDSACYEFYFNIFYAYILVESGYFDDADDLLDEIIDYLANKCTIFSQNEIESRLVYFRKEKKRCIDKTRNIDKLVMVMVNAFNGVKTDEFFSYLNKIFPNRKP